MKGLTLISTLGLATLLGGIACGSSSIASGAAFQTPSAVVGALYRLRSIPIYPAAKRRFFAHDLAAALIFDSRKTGDVGLANDGDYRYDAQDMQISDLRIGEPAPSADTAKVQVSFHNFGKTETVTYDLCHRHPNDWRIADVTAPSGSLRALLSLPSVQQSKVC